eukprot:9859203-Alexandrium_andersonii.AAC.1
MVIGLSGHSCRALGRTRQEGGQAGHFGIQKGHVHLNVVNVYICPSADVHEQEEILRWVMDKVASLGVAAP